MKSIRILLAEDNQGDILLVGRALQEHGIEHDLQVVADGEQALDYVIHMGTEGFPPCPDVMLLDLNLPKVDGLEVLAAFRKHPQCVHTPVIVVSSSSAPKDLAQIEEFGVTRYFRKPSSLMEFMKLGAVVRDAIADIPA